MKVIKTGAFFLDTNKIKIDNQTKQLKRLFLELFNQYGKDVVRSLSDDVLDQVVQLYLQSLSVYRIPLLITPVNDTPLLVNNINLASNTDITTTSQLFKYLSSLHDYRIVDQQGVALSPDELIQLIRQSTQLVKGFNLGRSLINNSNVLHSENDILVHDYQKSDWHPDTYVISLSTSIEAVNDCFNQIQNIDGLVVPASLDVQRDLAQYLFLNFRILFLKVMAHKIPVVFLPDIDNPFGIFPLIQNDATSIEQWKSRQFIKVDTNHLVQELLSDSRFDDTDLSKLQRLPVTDDADGSLRQLIKGTNKVLDTGVHYLDVINAADELKD